MRPCSFTVTHVHSHTATKHACGYPGAMYQDGFLLGVAGALGLAVLASQVGVSYPGFLL